MKNHVLSFVLASEKRAFCTNKSLINRTEIQGPLFPLQVSCLLLREGFLDYQSLSDSHTMCFFSTFSTLVLNDFYSGSLGSLLPAGIHSLWQQSSVQYLFPPLPQCGLATLHTLLPDPSHHAPLVSTHHVSLDLEHSLLTCSSCQGHPGEVGPCCHLPASIWFFHCGKKPWH